MIPIENYYIPHEPSQSPQRKQWCFTLYYLGQDIDVRIPTELPTCCTYLLFQMERCPETGRDHLQGYLSFLRPRRFTECISRLQSMFSYTGRPHVEPVRGSVDDNIAYCTKLESRKPGTDPFEFGQRPKRSVSKEKPTALCRKLLLDGKSPIEVLKDETLTEAHGTAFRLARTWYTLLGELIPDRCPSVEPVVLVFYGDSGLGKTRIAHQMYPNAYVKRSGLWWSLYTGQKEVIYDDFDGNSMTFTEWKQVFDRYPMLVEPKNSMCRLASTVHIITTNVYPSHWWSKKVTGKYGRNAIWRRITQLWEFDESWSKPIVHDDPRSFRTMNFTLEAQDPKGKE